MTRMTSVHCAARWPRLPPRALLVILAVASALAADPAMARRSRGGPTPGNQAARTAQPQAQSAPQSPQSIKHIAYPHRHGTKARGAGH